MTGPFQIHESVEDGCQIVCPAGELDLAEVATLGDRVRALAGRERTVTVDLSKLSFIDSSGIRLLCELMRDAEQQGWKLALRNPAPVVRETLQLVGVLGVLGLD